MSITPLAWKDRPSLIERILPAQKISAEAQKERKSGAGQTLTALGSYWKGRKPLMLVKACVLGALLPATDDAEKDLAIFERLMAIDDEAFVRRGFVSSPREVYRVLIKEGRLTEEQARNIFAVQLRQVEYSSSGKRNTTSSYEPFEPLNIAEIDGDRDRTLVWHIDLTEEEIIRWQVKFVRCHSYLTRLSKAKRPEELPGDELYSPIWEDVNSHLGTDAHSFPELIEQLGMLRFGRRPKVGDTFCGGGSIPFEAARLGCAVFASDLNPIACTLTWAALNIIGADAQTRKEIESIQSKLAKAVDQEITALRIEHDSLGNRAKAYLYCLETRCPQTGWMVPLAPSWVISKSRNVIARLIPDPVKKRFEIEIVSDASASEMEEAANGTVKNGELVYSLGGETYSTPVKTIRGDYRSPDGTTRNKLRRWELTDFKPRPEDIFQERLYCIQWITKATLHKPKPVTFFAGVTAEDLAREAKVEAIVAENLSRWQGEGLVPDMPIEPGAKTDEPIRTRGWTYWHHLFSARDLIVLYVFRKHNISPFTFALTPKSLNYASKLCQWVTGFARYDKSSGKQVGGASDFPNHVFYNQAFNTFYNYASRASSYTHDSLDTEKIPSFSVDRSFTVHAAAASELGESLDLLITDPPYADAIRYEEITDYFIAWLRKNPPQPFKNWVWDSRRALAIKGSGEDFRREMIAAYRAMANHMPDNGRQIVMFTHQDASVWADMTSIVWGAGLQVTAAWYIATETTSELKKGGYVQGTVLLVLRKRLQDEAIYRDELIEEVKSEVAHQIETMVGLNQKIRGHGRAENLFEDADLQMAGYAAALRVLTGYRRIDGQDMAAEALRPRQKGERDIVREIIDYAVMIANEHLVPEGIPAALWERCCGSERFYLKMLDMEAIGLKKLDNYQNFAKAFRTTDYGSLMGSMKANDARLKTAVDFRKSGFEGEFGKSALRAALFALYELQRELDSDEVMAHLRDLVPGYHTRREDLLVFCQFIAAKREQNSPEEAAAARVLLTRIKNERLGG